jgi:hypothetical protein
MCVYMCVCVCVCVVTSAPVRAKSKAASNLGRCFFTVKAWNKLRNILSTQDFQVLADVLRFHKFSMATTSDAADILGLMNLVSYSSQYVWYR